jgi:Dihydrofolate reductase
MKTIVAVDQNWGIGYKGKLLERIPADMKYFKQLTIGKTVIMGRETFLSLPGAGPLKDRINIVLCEDKQFSDKAITICSSMAELFSEIAKYPSGDIFVIGGEMVYSELLPYCTEAYVTRIEKTYAADKHFPNLDEHPGWKLAEAGSPQSYNQFEFSFDTYVNQEVKHPSRL